MFSRKFISMCVKALAKLTTFIVALCIAKQNMQYIVLIVHCFHPLITEEAWGLLLILDIKVGITFMRNKEYVLVMNITIMLQRKPLELSQSLRNQITPFHIKSMYPKGNIKDLSKDSWSTSQNHPPYWKTRHCLPRNRRKSWW